MSNSLYISLYVAVVLMSIYVDINLKTHKHILLPKNIYTYIYAHTHAQAHTHVQTDTHAYFDKDPKSNFVPFIVSILILRCILRKQTAELI